MTKYADRNAVRKAVANAGGIREALTTGLLVPEDMPDDELVLHARDMRLAQPDRAGAVRYTAHDEWTLTPAVQMFEHALGMEACEGRNAGARWILCLSEAS